MSCLSSASIKRRVSSPIKQNDRLASQYAAGAQRHPQYKLSNIKIGAAACDISMLYVHIAQSIFEMKEKADYSKSTILITIAQWHQCLINRRRNLLWPVPIRLLQLCASSSAINVNSIGNSNKTVISAADTFVASVSIITGKRIFRQVVNLYQFCAYVV